LRAFVEQAWPIVEPATPFRGNWHIDAWCDHLEGVHYGHIQKLLGNVPPGTSKSLMSGVFFPAWEWLRGTKWDDEKQERVAAAVARFLCGSFDEGLTIRDSGKSRDIIESEWFQARWPHVQFREGQNQQIKRVTTDGGWRLATSVGGRGTGEHPDIIIVDDPHNPKKAESDAERQAALDWFDRTLSTRGASRGARFIVVMQRLHQTDLSGHILQRADADEWTHFCVPMRYEPPAFVELKRGEVTVQVPVIPGTQSASQAKRTDIDLDPRKGLGELLWPDLFSESIVRSLEAALGSYGAAGQLQQRPAPAGGGLFKREWFEIVDAVPAGVKRARGWDKAGTDLNGDWTAGVKMAKSKDGLYYVEDVKRAQLSSGKRNALIKQTASLDGTGCRIRIEQEPGSGGKESAEISVRELAGYIVVVKPSTGDKVTRARPLAIQAEAGNVKLVRGPWNAQFIDELTVFPNGSNDDQVDGASSAFNELTLGDRDVVAAVTHDTSWQKGHFR